MSTEIVQVQSVFITGLNTTVGQALALKLRADGHTVAGTVNSSQEAAYFRAFGVTPAYSDLTRAGELGSAIQGTGATLLVNCAAQAANHAPQVSADWSLPLARYAEALADAAAKTKAEFVLHTSFPFAGGHLTDDTDGAELALDEAQAAETIALTSPVPTAVLRLGTVYGATDEALKSLRDSLLGGRVFDAGEDHVRASWIYAPDAASALAAALKVRPAGMTLDIVDDQPMTPAAFLRLFAELQSVGMPSTLPLFIRRSFRPELQRLIMKIETYPSNASARNTLDWAPRYPTAKAGLEDLLLVWRAAMGVQA
ncbi:MAG TPA: NAD-dependent epimerase/dehydratase family protein [Candidatus Limnocylindrales bacterium]|nr:NAD-dependent epimerase/dehydratase family protein [Candidatus Limnocylindrales bacterium]